MEHNPDKERRDGGFFRGNPEQTAENFMGEKNAGKVWCIQINSGHGSPFLAAVATSKEKAGEMQEALLQNQKMPTQSTILQFRTDTIYGESWELQPSEIKEQDKQKVWCYTVEPEYTESFIAGIATSEENREQMEEYLQRHFGQDGKIKMTEMKLDHMTALEHVAEQEQDPSHSIKEIDEKMQQLFPLLANGDTYVQETSCYGHQITAEIDPEEHLIKNVQIDGEDVYRAENGAASMENIAGLATLKLCDILESEERYDPTVYDFTPPPVSELTDDGRLWDEGIGKDISWSDDYILDPIATEDMER